jgi:hypothetical protein
MAESPDATNSRTDRGIAWAFLAAILGFVVWLALDKPPPNPDFHVYARQANDIAAMRQTAEKFPPLYPLMLAPFAGSGLAAQETAAVWIDVASFALFGIALLGILGRLGVGGASLVIAGVLANRYALGPTVAGTAHAPFWAFTALTVWACLGRRWFFAYALACAALLTRYNGAALPLVVAAWQLGTHWKDGSRGRRLGTSAIAVAAALSPLALWLMVGTKSGLGSYAEETKARGVAGPSAAKYPIAAVSVSVVDPDATKSISEGGSFMPVLLAAVPVFLLAVVGLGALWKSQRAFVGFCVAWGAWWAAVHTRFAEVGGLYLYSVQVTWVVWILAAAGLSLAARATPWLWILGATPLAGAIANSTTTHMWAAAGAGAGAVVSLLCRLKPVQAWSTVIAAGAIAAIGGLSAYEKIYEKNYRAATLELLEWSRAESGILISTGMFDELRAEGRSTAPFVPEERVNGDDPGSLASLGIRFAAVGDWELAERDKPDFFPGHEFFLGSRYSSSLRPYRMIAGIRDGEGWRKVREIRSRETTITIYERE